MLMMFYYIVDKSYLFEFIVPYGCRFFMVVIIKEKRGCLIFFQGIQAPNFTEDSPLYSYLMEQEIREEAAMHALAEKKVLAV